MWTYEQNSGKLFDNSMRHIATGYAGGNCGKNPEGVNNPSMQEVRKIGPLPVGKYCIEDPVEHPHLGPFAMPLKPYPDNVMFGRSGFYIHGDSVKNPGSASEGCIIMNRITREKIWSSNDHEIEVV